MVFKCNNSSCGDIWFIQRLYDEPKNNRCPHCGCQNYEWDALSITELETLVEDIKTNKYPEKYSSDFFIKYLDRIVQLETMIVTLDKLTG